MCQGGENRDGRQEKQARGTDGSEENEESDERAIECGALEGKIDGRKSTKIGARSTTKKFISREVCIHVMYTKVFRSRGRVLRGKKR